MLTISNKLMKIGAGLTLLLFSMISYAQNAGIDYYSYAWEENPAYEVPQFEEGEHSEVIIKEKRVLEFIFESNEFNQYDLRHEVIYIASEAGVEENNKIYLSTADDEYVVYQKARVISPGGKIITFKDEDVQEGEDEETGYKYQYFALDGLEIGSFVELLFLIKKSDMHKGARKLFQTSVERRNFDFEFISPEYLIFDFHSLNGFPTMELDTTLDGKNYWKVHIDTINKYESEPMSFTTSNRQGVLYKLLENTYSGSKDMYSYGDMSKNYYEYLYNSVTKSEKKAIKKFLKKIGIKKDMNPLEKVALMENHFKENFAILPYVQPEYNEIKTVLEKKVSSKSTYLRIYANALKLMDIDHQIVLTSDRTNLRFSKEFDSYSFLQKGFIYLTKQQKYLDPGSAELRLGYVPWEYMHTYGLFIKPLKIGDIESGIGKVRFIEALPKEATVHNHYITVDMTEDPFEPTISFEEHMGGYYSSSIQTSYKFLSEEEKERLEEALLENLVAEKSEAKLEVVNTEPIDFGKKPMILKTELKSLKFTEKAGNKVIFKIGELIGRQMEMYNEKPREHGVENNHNRTYERKIELLLPEGYELTNVDKLEFDVSMPDGSCVFKSKVTQSDDKLVVVIDEYYTQIDYPVEQFEDYQKVINAAADFNKVVLYLAKKS